MANTGSKKKVASQINRQGERKINLAEVIEALMQDGLITREQADKLYRMPPDPRQPDAHSLTQIANEKITSAKLNGQILDLETLSHWFAGKIGLPYFRIDPLKIDVAAAASVMKYSYAERNRIIPVDVTDSAITVATAEPYLKEWAQEIAHISKKEIKRVFANPEDIGRYIIEFYSLARSVSGASEESKKNELGIGNLEQLVELSRAGKLDASDQHVVTIVDWLLQYAFDQRASDIHLEPRRDQSPRASRYWGVWTLPRNDARKMAGLKPKHQTARKLNYACRPCPRLLAKNWSCESLIRKSSSGASTNLV